MYLPRVQDQLTTSSLKAIVWSCVKGAEGACIRPISKQFAHRGSFSPLCARLAVGLVASLRNPEDTY